MQIKFGTDGWRGIIAKDYTFETVKKVASAFAEFLKTRKGNLVIIGYDTRFLSNMFAEEVGKVIKAKGVEVILSSEVSPTPEVSWTVPHKKADAGIVITASHNPYYYNGFKIKTEYGGPAGKEITNEIERIFNEVDIPEVNEISIHKEDFKTHYLEHLRNTIDQAILMKSPKKIVVDPMYGAGQGYIKEILEPLGWDILEIHGEINPYFGGGRPEPTKENLQKLSKTVIDEEAFAGVATDGDADRLGIIDGEGNFITPHEIFALLLQHLVEDKGLRGKVYKNFATSDMIDKLCKKYEIECITTPIGFKFISEMMKKEGGIIGGEESGGIGVPLNSMERDGIFCSLLLLQMAVYRDKTIQRMKKELFDEIGPHYTVRKDISTSPDFKLIYPDGDRIGPYKISKVEDIDGKKYRFENGGWILIRASGTEPLIRIYSESSSLKEAKNQISAMLKEIGLKSDE